MIWLLNRRELWCGFSVDALAKVRQALAAAGIPYAYRTASRAASAPRGRAPLGRAFEDPLASTLYYVYVKRADYARAKASLP